MTPQEDEAVKHGPIATNPQGWEKLMQKIKIDIIGWLSAALLVIALIFGAWTVNCDNFDKSQAKPSIGNSQGSNGNDQSSHSSMDSRKLNSLGKWKAAVLVFWILAPPVWFWLEYFGVYRYGANAKLNFEYYKHQQDISSKVWLALVTVLTILYFGKDLKGG